MSVATLVLRQTVPSMHDEAAGIDEPAVPARLGLRKAVPRHRTHDELRDTDGSFARAQEQYLLVGQFAAGDAQCREQPGKRDRRGALDVVVERRHLAPVLFEEAKRVVIGEILELYDDAGENLVRSSDEFIDERIVRFTRDAALTQPDIVGIGKELGVVGSDVDRHRQADARIDTGTARVKGELSDRDAHAVCA